MEEKVVKEALSYSLASDLHAEWCSQELRAFFLRAQEEFAKTQNYGQALRQACYKGDTKRNEVEIDTGWLVGHETIAKKCLEDFEIFKSLFIKGVIEVKRFTKRNLSSEEIKEAGNNYVDGKENILRSFNKISSSSQKDNLEAARVAINLTYDKMMTGEIITDDMLEEMGSFVHEEWLKRNQWVFDPNYGNQSLAVPYEKLTEEEKDKDKVQIIQAGAKIQSYKNKMINIDNLCENFKIEKASKHIA